MGTGHISCLFLFKSFRVILARTPRTQVTHACPGGRYLGQSFRATLYEYMSTFSISFMCFRVVGVGGCTGREGTKGGSL